MPPPPPAGAVATRLLLLAAVLVALAAQPAAAQAQYSNAWGVNGELWRPTGRLSDFSFSGYMAGESAIPSYPEAVRVTDPRFAGGAKGDGRTDDSEAFAQAIRAASAIALNLTTTACRTGRCPLPHNGFQNSGAAGVAVYVPPGRYVIRRMLEITQSNVVVRGAGPGQTTLFFPAPLKQLYGNLMEWQFAGGFLNVLAAAERCPGSTKTPSPNVAGGTSATLRSSSRWVGREMQLWLPYYNSCIPEPGAESIRLPSPARQPGPPAPLPKLPPPPLIRSAPLKASLWASGCGCGCSSPAGPPPAAARCWGWIRIKLLHPQQAAAGICCNGPAAAAAAAAPAGSRTYLPLSEAAAAARFSFASEALEDHSDHESGGSSGTQPQRPVVASASGTLDAHLYGENAVDSGSAPFPLERSRFASRVAAVGNGWIELERPLLHDLRVGWQVGVYKFEQTVQHSGWEAMTLEFPHTLTRTHFDVDGWNGIYMAFTANCWARNIRILNADQGAEAINSDFITFRTMVLDVTAPRTGPQAPKGTNGHHGMWTAASSNVLFTQFDIRTTFIHDLTLDVWAHECVFSNGKGTNLNTDMHRGGPHHNLWTNLDVGQGTRPFASSGNASRGAHAARLNTWWNIFSSLAGVPAPKLPDCGFGALLNFVGAFGALPGGAAAGRNVRYPGWCVAAPLGWYVELPTNGAKSFSPADLHSAMVLTRSQRLAATKRA